jgi:hypothetical protein
MAEVDEPAMEIDELVGVLGETVASGECVFNFGLGLERMGGG